jgi:hypothetical protein
MFKPGVFFSSGTIIACEERTGIPEEIRLVELLF